MYRFRSEILAVMIPQLAAWGVVFLWFMAELWLSHSTWAKYSPHVKLYFVTLVLGSVVSAAALLHIRKKANTKTVLPDTTAGTKLISSGEWLKSYNNYPLPGLLLQARQSAVRQIQTRLYFFLKRRLRPVARFYSGLAAFKPYLLHTRPLFIPVVSLQYSLGYALAGGFQSWPNFDRFLLGLIIWAVLGHGATLCINSHYDRDSGDVAFLHNQPAPPKYLNLFGLGIASIGLLLTVLLMPVPFLVAFIIAGALALLYSHPLTRIKNNLGLSPLVNGAGYCIITPYAGWAVTSPYLQEKFIWISIGMLFLSFAGYWITQIYQIEDDRRSGCRTMAVAAGPKPTLIFVFFSGAIGYGLIVHTIFIKQMPVMITSIAIPIALGLSGLVYWFFRAYHRIDKPMMYFFFFILLLTDASIIAATLGAGYYHGWLVYDLFR